MTTPILSCHGLTKKFGNFPALNDVSFQLEPGRIVGLLGPNGSGKTTFLKLVNQLLVPTSGEILVNGQPLTVQTKAMISYLPDKNYLNDWMKVHQLIRMISDFYADFVPDTAYGMLERLGISPDSRLRTMSKGTREKVQLILVMSRKARLYLLDEPIGGVDPATRDYILNTIIGNYNEDATVLISTHLIADVEKVLDEVLFINNGVLILQDTVDHIREQKGTSVDGLFREVFKC